MMKKILAAAIVSAFAAPAFAATANVDVYGIIALSVDYVDGGSTTVAPGFTAAPGERRARVSSNTSIIGFKGAEDLGGGLSAIWQIESAVPMDTNSTVATISTNRETFGGLSSKTLGSVTFGLRDTALKLATAPIDVYRGGNYLADYRSLFGAVSNGSIRAGNSVTYISPKFGDMITVRGTTAAMQEDGSSRDPHLYSLSATYDKGPLFLTVAHEDMKFARVAAANTMAGAGGYTIVTSTTGGGANGAETEQKNTRVGAAYTLGDLRIGAAWERTSVDVARIGTATLTAAGVTGLTSVSTDRDAWYLSGAFKLGNNTLKAAYTRADDLDGVANSGAQQFSFGVDNALSKRTTVYALFTQLKNDSAANYTLGGSPADTGTFQSGGGTGVSVVSAAAVGQDPRALSIGMIHRF